MQIILQGKTYPSQSEDPEASCFELLR